MPSKNSLSASNITGVERFILGRLIYKDTQPKLEYSSVRFFTACVGETLIFMALKPPNLGYRRLVSMSSLSKCLLSTLKGETFGIISDSPGLSCSHLKSTDPSTAMPQPGSHPELPLHPLPSLFLSKCLGHRFASEPISFVEISSALLELQHLLSLSGMSFISDRAFTDLNASLRSPHMQRRLREKTSMS